MQEYYEKLAHTSFSHKAYVMPCFNEVLDNKIFEKKDYSKKHLLMLDRLIYGNALMKLPKFMLKSKKKYRVPFLRF